MRDALILLAALAGNVLGFAWLALATQGHWRQVRGSQPMPRHAVAVLRVLGALALALSLWLCLSVDHVSMASLVWVMALAAAALAVALALAWRPRLLAPLVAWLRAAAGR